MQARRLHAFTLVEIMIAVTIIGLLAGIAIPALIKARQASLAIRVVNDLKKLGDDFNILVFSDPSMPAGSYNANGTGQVPAGFDAGDLPKSIYGQPINGRTRLSFDLYENTAADNEGAVVLTPTGGYALDTALMLMIDTKMDDGDLATGTVHMDGAQLVYVAHRL